MYRDWYTLASASSSPAKQAQPNLKGLPWDGRSIMQILICIQTCGNSHQWHTLSPEPREAEIVVEAHVAF